MNDGFPCSRRNSVSLGEGSFESDSRSDGGAVGGGSAGGDVLTLD